MTYISKGSQFRRLGPLSLRTSGSGVVVFIILCVAVLNLALGFALAVFLQGGQFEWATGRRLLSRLKFFSWAKSQDEDLGDALPTADQQVQAAMTASSADNSEPVENSTSENNAVEVDDDATTDEETHQDLNEASLAFRSLAAALPPTEPTTDEDSRRSSPRIEVREVDDAAITAAIEGMKSELARYRSEIATLDGRLRRCAAAPDAPTVQACVTDLQRTNETYLQEQDARREELRAAAHGDSGSIVRSLAQAAEEQTAAVAAAQAGLAKLDLETDLLAQCHELLNETRQISEASESLHSSIGDVLEAMSDVSDEPAAEPEPKPSAHARKALVAVIESWWQANAGPNRRLAAALIEPDHLDRSTEEHGRTIVDHALRAISSIVTTGLAAGQTAAKPSGETYLLLMPDTSPREAVRFVERSRQQIDATRFRHGNKKFHLTVSCSVAESDRIEDAAALVARLEAMLAEAKRYGRNRTFFQEGDIPAPAVPPALSIEPQVIDLDAVG